MAQKILDLVEWLDRWFFRKVNVLTSFSSTLTDTKVPSAKLVKNSLDNKVDKVQGKGLSTNDYDNIAKTKVDSLATVATTGSYNDLSDKPSISASIEIDDVLDANSNNPVTNSAIVAEFNNHTHSYNNITNKPTIPTKTSELQNDSGFLTQHQDISGKANISDLARVATTGSYNDLTDRPTISAGGEITDFDFGFDSVNKEIYLRMNEDE